MLTTGNQLRAARALAELEQADVAGVAGLNVNTIRSMEKAGAGPIAGRAANVHAVQRALEAAGVEFLNHGQPGVKLRLLRKGDRVRLRPASARHGQAFGVALDDALTVEAADVIDGQGPYPLIRLRSSQGALTDYLPPAHFERTL